METLDRGAEVENYRNEGISVECCAGLVDKNKPISQVAAEEVFEETGYQVDADRLEQFGKFRRIDSGAYQNLFYVEVTNVDRVGEGGGLAVSWVNKCVSNEKSGRKCEKGKSLP